MIHYCIHFVYTVATLNSGCHQPFLNKDEQIFQYKNRIHLLIDLNLQGMCNRIISNRSYYLLLYLLVFLFLFAYLFCIHIRAPYVLALELYYQSKGLKATRQAEKNNNL